MQRSRRTATCARLGVFIEHCREHGRITAQEASAVYGCSVDVASAALRRFAAAGWFERIELGVYEQTFKAAQWHGTLTARLTAAYSQAASFSVDEAAEAMKDDRKRVREQLRWMRKDGRLERVDVNVYRFLMQGVACEAAE